MADAERLSRAELRLLDELDDDGVRLDSLVVDRRVRELVISELDWARRPPVHEGRTFAYGAFVMTEANNLIESSDLVELIELDAPLEDCRRFADGRATFLVHGHEGGRRLACFRRSVQFESELVEIQAATGAVIVQRTGHGGVPRMFTTAGVTEWNGRSWVTRPTAKLVLAAMRAGDGFGDTRVVEGLLDVCVHWLSPSRIGATLLYDFDPRHDDAPSLDLDAAVAAPSLSVLRRHHYGALVAALRTTDLAALVASDGTIDHFGVGLRSSPESERAVAQDGGMRHRSAARYTWDHHHTIAVVVSEDGPVTVFRQGRPTRVCVATPPPVD